MQRNINQASSSTPNNRINEHQGQNRKSFNNHNSFFSSFNPARAFFSLLASTQTAGKVDFIFSPLRNEDFSVPLNLVYWQQMWFVRFVIGSSSFNQRNRWKTTSRENFNNSWSISVHKFWVPSASRASGSVFVLSKQSPFPKDLCRLGWFEEGSEQGNFPVEFVLQLLFSNFSYRTNNYERKKEASY